MVLHILSLILFHSLSQKEVRNKMIHKTLHANVNSLFEEKKFKKQIPNSIMTFFLIMQYMYGFDFGFNRVSNKKLRRLCKLITLLICLYTSVILLLPTPIFASNWNIKSLGGYMYFVQYCGHIILLYFSKYNVYNFVSDIRSVDDGIIYNKEHKIGCIALIVFASWFVMTMSLSALICLLTNAGCWVDNNRVNVIYVICATGIDAIVLVQLIANFYTYYAVTYLVGLVGKEKTSLIRKQYLRVSECCEKFGGFYEKFVSIIVSSIRL